MITTNLFTEDEKLFQRVSYERALEIINRDDTIILSCEISHNTYGEFLFIYFRYQDTFLCIYGLGEHTYRERWVDTFSIYDSNIEDFEGGMSLDKEEVIKQIHERTKVKERYKDIEQIEQTELGFMYDLLADIGDEDGAAVIIDDYYNFREGLA